MQKKFMLPVICLDAYFEHSNLNQFRLCKKTFEKSLQVEKESKTHFANKCEPLISFLTFQGFPMVRLGQFRHLEREILLSVFLRLLFKVTLQKTPGNRLVCHVPRF